MHKLLSLFNHILHEDEFISRFAEDLAHKEYLFAVFRLVIEVILVEILLVIAYIDVFLTLEFFKIRLQILQGVEIKDHMAYVIKAHSRRLVQNELQIVIDLIVLLLGDMIIGAHTLLYGGVTCVSEE